MLKNDSDQQKKKVWNGIEAPNVFFFFYLIWGRGIMEITLLVLG